MRYFLTGATGFIGQELAKQLLSRGDTVHALVRSPEKARQITGENLKLFPGDVNNPEVIDKAIAGCDYVFHLAGYARPWSRDKNLPHRINVEGTGNVLEAALNHKVRKLVFTSTAGTLKPSEKNECVDENSLLPENYLTSYEQTKREAEKLCLDYTAKGLDVVIVNPTRVYGPGLLSKSNSVTTIIKQYQEGRWHFIPGTGNETGNYVFIDDIVSGHLLALQRGKPGESYILGGDNVSFNQFFTVLSEESGKKPRLFKLPLPFLILVSALMLFLANEACIEPVITPGWVKRYNQNRALSSRKAIQDLGYTATPLHSGIRKTLEWLKSNKV